MSDLGDASEVLNLSLYGNPEKTDEDTPEPDALQKLAQLSVTHQIEEMALNMKNDDFVIEGMVPRGTTAHFYGWPGVGKTLFFERFIIDGIQAGNMNPEKIIYVNADDNYTGLYTKALIARKHGYNMISPQYSGVKNQKIIMMIAEVARTGNAEEVVIFLDTLKKFVDMMNKGAQKAFFDVLRGINTKGGTVIIAGHANKHKNADGELIFEGTSDTKSDIDILYAMYQISERDSEDQMVEFRCEKDRGAIDQKVSFTYQKAKGMRYIDMVMSIERLDKEHASKLAKEKHDRELMDQYEAERLFVCDLLTGGPMNQSEIIAALEDNPNLKGEITKRKLTMALNRLNDVSWVSKRGGNNAKVFSLPDYESNQYRKYSRG